MRSLVYFVACTLDGYIAGLDGATDYKIYPNSYALLRYRWPH